MQQQVLLSLNAPHKDLRETEKPPTNHPLYYVLYRGTYHQSSRQPIVGSHTERQIVFGKKSCHYKSKCKSYSIQRTIAPYSDRFEFRNNTPGGLSTVSKTVPLDPRPTVCWLSTWRDKVGAIHRCGTVLQANTVTAVRVTNASFKIQSLLTEHR